MHMFRSSLVASMSSPVAQSCHARCCPAAVQMLCVCHGPHTRTAAQLLTASIVQSCLLLFMAHAALATNHGGTASLLSLQMHII